MVSQVNSAQLGKPELEIKTDAALLKEADSVLLQKNMVSSMVPLLPAAKFCAWFMKVYKIVNKLYQPCHHAQNLALQGIQL